MKKYIVLFVSLLFFSCKKEKSDIVPYEFISINKEVVMSVYKYNGYLQISILVELDSNNQELMSKKYSELITSAKDKWNISLISLVASKSSINFDFINKIRAVNKELFLSNGLTHKYDFDREILLVEFAKPSLPITNGENTVDK
jgi:hypothetical protein